MSKASNSGTAPRRDEITSNEQSNPVDKQLLLEALHEILEGIPASRTGVGGVDACCLGNGL